MEELVFAGGSSRMKGLISFLQSLDFGVKIKLGQALYHENSSEYIEAVGLALRNLDEKWSRTDPCLKVGSRKNKSLAAI